MRGFVDRTITVSSETFAAHRKSPTVEIEDTVKAYIMNTPRAMAGMMKKALREKGVLTDSIEPEDNLEERDFPIGGPMSREEVEEFLHRKKTGRLGTCAKGRPYVVPLSYVYVDGKIYYHWFSYSGRKLDNIRENRNVCFEADESSHDHVSYRSVIADGRISSVTDKAEKAKVMRALAEKFPFYATGAGHNKEIDEIVKVGFDAMIEAVEIYRIDIERISGKKK